MIWGQPWTDVITALSTVGAAIGTVGAVIFSVAIAARQSKRARLAESALADERESKRAEGRQAVAGLISAWAESNYVPSADGTQYLRTVTAYISNESNEPVYSLLATVKSFSTGVQLGPLSIPPLIAVLPPRRSRSWDITTGLFAHSTGTGAIPGDPLISLEFEDIEGINWRRDYDGSLTKNPETTPPASTEATEAQVGPLDSGFNPMLVAQAFMSEFSSYAELKDLRPLLSPTAKGWNEMSPDDLTEFQGMYANYGIAAHVWYPTSRVAYIRLVHPDDIKTVLDGRPGRVAVLTLTYLAGTGWRVFSLGQGVTEPDWIEFPRKDLHRSLRGRP